MVGIDVIIFVILQLHPCVVHWRGGRMSLRNVKGEGEERNDTEEGRGEK